MTNTEKPPSLGLEPAVTRNPFYTDDTDAVRAAYSQAVSLKRIADALERLAAPKALPTYLQFPGAIPIVSASPPPTPAPDNGWQAWPGGECPVPKGTPVDVRFRDGQELRGVAAGESASTNRGASQAFWEYDYAPNDIVAWRLAK